jgi:hypothetical protein
MSIVYYSVFSTELQNSDHLVFLSPNVTGTGNERGRNWNGCLRRTEAKWRRRLREKGLWSSSRKSWNDIWSWKGTKSKEKKLYAGRR